MSVQNKRIAAATLALCCLVLGILCYSLPSSSSGNPPPRRYLVNAGGNILFDHAAHNDDFQLDCSDCHHQVLPKAPPNSSPCRSCHQKALPTRAAKSYFDHDLHSEELGLDCSDCHHTYAPENDEEPGSCADCHGNSEPGIPDRTEAFHLQCIGCHREYGAGPEGDSCAACHQPRPPMDAFHDQCIGCHTDLGAGPDDAEDQCQRCHAF